MNEFTLRRVSISLLQLPGVGKVTAGKLLPEIHECNPGGPEELFDLLETLRDRGRKVPDISFSDVTKAHEEAERCLDRCDELDIRVICKGDEAMPRHFWGINDPPLVLYARGRVGCIEERVWMAIVGSRKATEFGLKSGHKFGMRCAEENLGVVSGLAIGCDASAHRGCMDACGVTVSFMAHGLDTVHPASNRNLAARIVDEGGCMFSEYVPGVEPRPNQYIERDRLQSALSHGVIIVETTLNGGTMHAVKSAKKQGRLLGCLDHPEGDFQCESAEGNQLLIQNGDATALADKNDLLSFIKVVKASTPGTGIQGDLFRTRGDNA